MFFTNKKELCEYLAPEICQNNVDMEDGAVFGRLQNNAKNIYVHQRGYR